MAVDPVNAQQPPANTPEQEKFETALNESLVKGVVMIGQFVIMPMIKEATSDADAFSDEE